MVEAADALRTIAAFRLALPRTILRFAGGRELTLGDLGARQGVVGGINAIIVGNYLTTLGRDPQDGPRPAGRAVDAGEGAVRRRCEAPVRRCVAGSADAVTTAPAAEAAAEGDHARCRAPRD